MPATHVGETSGRTRNNRLRHLSPEGNHLYINAGRESLNQNMALILGNPLPIPNILFCEFLRISRKSSLKNRQIVLWDDIIIYFIQMRGSCL